jgi:hypothetical protein
MIEIWIARDGDGDLYAFTDEPSWNESNEVWEPNGDSALLDMDTEWLKQVRPGEALRFAPTMYGYKRQAVKGEYPKCTCGADSDPGACGHHPLCPMKTVERK